MSTERRNYNIKNYFFRHLFIFFFCIAIGVIFYLLTTLPSIGELNDASRNQTYTQEDFFSILGWIGLGLVIVSLLLLYLQIWINTHRKFPLWKIPGIIFHPERYSQYIIEISSIITFLVLTVSFGTSFWILADDKNSVRDFLANGSFVNMFFALFISVWSLLITVIVMRQQRNEIKGFPRFLSEVTEMLHEANARTAQTGRTEKVYIVDFHPFIGCKSLGFKSRYFCDYLEALASVASSWHIEVVIICHTESLIKNKFSNKPAITSFLGIKDLSICTALQNLSKENKVSVWRSNGVGPYHFMIIGDEAIEYLVIPSNSIANENQLIATKTIDKSRVDYLELTALDLLSASIKPVLANGSGLIDLTSKAPVEIKFDTEQENITGIKLRFQFEEEDAVSGLESVVNYKKGYYPDEKEKFFHYCEKNYLQLRQKNLNPGRMEVVYWVYENDSFQDNPLFEYDNDLVWLTNRIVNKNIVKNNTYLKIKIRNGNNLESQYSHKVEIKLW